MAGHCDMSKFSRFFPCMCCISFCDRRLERAEHSNTLVFMKLHCTAQALVTGSGSDWVKVLKSSCYLVNFQCCVLAVMSKLVNITKGRLHIKGSARLFSPSATFISVWQNRVCTLTLHFAKDQPLLYLLIQD